MKSSPTLHNAKKNFINKKIMIMFLSFTYTKENIVLCINIIFLKIILKLYKGKVLCPNLCPQKQTLYKDWENVNEKLGQLSRVNIRISVIPLLW